MHQLSDSESPASEGIHFMGIVDVPVRIWKQKKKMNENTAAKMINDQTEIFISFLW